MTKAKRRRGTLAPTFAATPLNDDVDKRYFKKNINSKSFGSNDIEIRELVRQMMKMGIRVMMKVLVKLPSEAWKKWGLIGKPKKALCC